MEDFDVVIVGSGPAGSAAAKTLTANGIRVAIVEKEKLPRYKICSGIIAPSVQGFVSKYFGEIPEGCYSQPKSIKGMKVLSADGGIMETPPLEGGAQILSVWRSSFDNWLARESGAVIRDDCRFVDFTEEDDRLIVKLASGSNELRLRANYLVGADGGNSTVRKIVAPDFDEQEFLAVAYEEHWTGSVDLDPDFFYIFLDKKFVEFPMAAFSAKDDRFVVVSSGWKGSSIKGLHKNLMDHLQKTYKFKPEKLVHSGGCLANIGSCKNHYELGKANILLIGEAGGFLGGKTEGITPALNTGYVAALTILESMESGVEAVSIYQEKVEEEKKRIRAQQEQDKDFVMPIS